MKLLEDIGLILITEGLFFIRPAVREYILYSEEVSNFMETLTNDKNYLLRGARELDEENKYVLISLANFIEMRYSDREIRGLIFRENIRKSTRKRKEEFTG